MPEIPVIPATESDALKLKEKFYERFYNENYHLSKGVLNEILQWFQEQEDLEILKKYAAKFNEIETIVTNFYVDENGDEKEEGDLVDIGEAVASYLGFI